MKINFKIMVRSGLVVIVSLLACGTVIYVYFNSIFTEQVIADETIKLQQIADQLQYAQNDILNFSNTVIVNPRIRANLSQYETASAVDRLYLIYSTLRELQTLSSLRDDIQGYAIVTKDGLAHWKSGTHPIRDEPWYQKFQEQRAHSAFVKPSKVLFDNTLGNKSSRDILTFITKIYDYHDPDQLIGEFVLELDLARYKKFVENGTNDFGGFIWLIKNQAIIYEKQYARVLYEAMPDLRNLMLQHQGQSSFHHEGANGYYYVNQSIANDWLLMSYTPKSFILKKSMFILYFVFAVILLSTLIIILLLNPVIRNITKPIVKLNWAFKQVANGNLDVSVDIRSNDEMEHLGRNFNWMAVDLKKHIQESMEHERNRQEMQFNLMLSQINPHFIYNTLNSVIYLARKKKHREIIELMSAFIYLLQDSIKLGEKEAFVTIEREIDMINNYVQIQKFRYQNKFELEWDVEDGLSDTPIPKYLLQPLVENALYHGIMPKEGQGSIRIGIRCEQEHLVLSVRDDGVGMTPEAKERLFSGRTHAAANDARSRHIGLDNISQRLSILYGSEMKIEVESAPMEGTCIVIRIPCRELKDRKSA